MYKYPQRRQYKYIIPTIKGDCILQFNQATANQTKEYVEIMEMLINDDIEVKSKGIELQNEYLKKFLQKWYPCKRYECKKRQIRSIVFGDISSYMAEILGMYHKSRETIYKNVSIKAVNGEKTRQYPFENMFDTIAKNALIPVDEVYDRLTMEQIGRYADKILYDSYEQFPEGKTANIQAMMQLGLSEEQKSDLELIKRFS